MNTNLLKKGRSAIAIVLSLALILTTATFPVSVAKADVWGTYKTDVVFSDYQGNIAPNKITSTTVPATTDFIFIKQASATQDLHYLWTPTQITNKNLKHDILLYVRDHDPSLQNVKQYPDSYWENFNNFIWGYDGALETVNNSSYSFTLQSINEKDYTVIGWDSVGISHIDFGNYDYPKYEITVTKAVTLNGEASNPLLDTTFYVSLFDANGKVAGTQPQPIVIDNGVVKNTVTFTVTDKTKTYYIYETDADGKILNPGIDFEGYYLKSITNQGNPITVVSTTVPATLTITNNLVEREPDTIPVEIQKTLVGRDLAAGQFSFTLVEAEIVKDVWTPLDTATPDVQTNALNGKVNFKDLKFAEEGTFYYIIFENIPKTTDADWMNGMVYDSHEIHITIDVSEEDGIFNADVTSMTGATTFTNTQQYGQISVTKAIDDSKSTKTVKGTFYAGLFTKDDEGYTLVKFGDDKAIVEIEVVDSVAVGDPKVFAGLDLNETYYIFETNAAGAIIETDGVDNGSGNIKPVSAFGWFALEYDVNEFTLTPKNLTGAATITNYFADFEKPYDPSIKVIKTVTVNNKPTASNLTFYAGLFADSELKTLLDVQPLEMKGSPTATASFVTYKDSEGVEHNLQAGGIYYIAETDKDGKALAGTAKELGFKITINSVSSNNTAVELIEDETTVNIVNNFTKEEFPLTGDNSNMNLWLFLAMLGVAGAIAPFAFRKKEVTND